MAIKKIDYYGRFEATGPDFSTAKRFQALAGLADQVGEAASQFGQVALQERADKASKAGALAGAKVERDEEGNIIAPELQEDTTYYGQAFNESAINSYKSGIALDAKRRLDELAVEFKDDPAAYKEKADAYQVGLIKGLPPEIQAEILPQLEQDIYFRERDLKKSFVDRTFQKNLTDVRSELDSLENEILYAARNNDTEKQQALEARLYKRIEEVGAFVDPAEAKTRLDNLSKNVAEEIYLGEIDRIVFNEDEALTTRLAKGEKFLSDLRELDFFEDLTPDEKRALEQKIDVRVNDVRIAVAKEASQRSSEIALEVSNLEIAAANNLRPGDEIIADANRLFKNEDITGDERTSIINRVYSNQGKTLDKNRRILDVSDRIKGDSSVVVEQKGIDEYYEDILEPQLEGVENKSLVQANYISATRMVPSKIKRQVNQFISSGDPALITEAAMLVDRVDEIPGMFDAMVPPSAKIFATNMIRLMSVMSPEKAYDLSKQYLGGEMDQARISQRQAEIKKEKYPEKYSQWTKDIVGDVSPISMGLAVQQYQTVFEAYFTNGADKDTAQEQAEKFLNTNYSDSAFGPMMYPPEQYYAISGDIEYMREEIIAGLSQGSDIYGDIDPDSIMLLSDDVTARTASEGKPMYKISFIDENGIIQTTNEYFMPDVDAARQRKLEEARARIEEKRALTPAQQKLEQSRIDRIIEEETGVKPERVRTKVKPASEIYKDVTVYEDYADLVERGLVMATTPQRAALGLISQVGEVISKKGKSQRAALQESTEKRRKEEERLRRKIREENQ